MHFRSGSHRYSVILSTRMHPIVLTAKLVLLYPYIAYQDPARFLKNRNLDASFFIHLCLQNRKHKKLCIFKYSLATGTGTYLMPVSMDLDLHNPKIVS